MAVGGRVNTTAPSTAALVEGSTDTGMDGGVLVAIIVLALCGAAAGGAFAQRYCWPTSSEDTTASTSTAAPFNASPPVFDTRFNAAFDTAYEDPVDVQGGARSAPSARPPTFTAGDGHQVPRASAVNLNSRTSTSTDAANAAAFYEYGMVGAPTQDGGEPVAQSSTDGGGYQAPTPVAQNSTDGDGYQVPTPAYASVGVYGGDPAGAAIQEPTHKKKKKKKKKQKDPMASTGRGDAGESLYYTGAVSDQSPSTTTGNAGQSLYHDPSVYESTSTDPQYDHASQDHAALQYDLASQDHADVYDALPDLDAEADGGGMYGNDNAGVLGNAPSVAGSENMYEYGDLDVNMPGGEAAYMEPEQAAAEGEYGFGDMGR